MGKKEPKEMADNVKSIKQRNEKAIDELISGFTFGVLTQNTYNDNFQKQKSCILLYAAKKRIQLLKKRKTSLLVKNYDVMTTEL